MTMPDQVSVTQEDREAAADLIEQYWSGVDASMMKLAASYRAGHSQGAFVRAFARHRQAAIQKARADALEEAAKVAESDDLILSESRKEGSFGRTRADHGKLIATAIRSLTEREVSRTPSLSLLDR